MNDISLFNPVLLSLPFPSLRIWTVIMDLYTSTSVLVYFISVLVSFGYTCKINGILNERYLSTIDSWSRWQSLKLEWLLCYTRSAGECLLISQVLWG